MIKKLTITLFSVLSFFNLSSQTEYNFTHSTETYTELTAATDISSAVWVSQQKLIALPFEFKYFDKTYDTIYVYPMQASFNNILGTFDNIFLGQDNYIPHQNSPSLSPVSYKTDGTAPNRIFKIQFKNVKAQFVDAEEEYTVNGQMWFYETSSKFEFRFGPNVITDLNFTEFFIGFIDADNSPYLAISGTAASPTLVRVMNVGNFKGIPSHPLNGQIYTFNPTSNPSTSISNIVKQNYSLGQTQDGISFLSQFNTKIEVFNIEGKLVNSFDAIKDIQTFQSTQQLTKGIYILKFSINNQLFTEKLIVY